MEGTKVISESTLKSGGDPGLLRSDAITGTCFVKEDKQKPV